MRYLIIALLCGHLVKKEIEPLEKVQKKATKILPALRWLPYSERLKACQIPTLHYRRKRGDMIESYKIITGKYQGCVAPSLIKEDKSSSGDEIPERDVTYHLLCLLIYH